MKTLNRTAYTLLVLAIILGMCSCGIPQSPCKVTYIQDWGNNLCLYQYQGSNQTYGTVIDSCGKYNIGDTIK